MFYYHKELPQIHLLYVEHKYVDTLNSRQTTWTVRAIIYMYGRFFPTFKFPASANNRLWPTC